MVSAAKANLDALVASCRLAQSRADSIVSELTMQVEAMVQGDRLGGRPRWGSAAPPRATVRNRRLLRAAPRCDAHMLLDRFRAPSPGWAVQVMGDYT
jgi:hypothetical protein